MEVDQRDDGTLIGHLPVTDAVRAPSGEPLLGVVATMVDMMGGMASIRACTPDRVATADMSLHLLPTGGTDRLDGTMHIRRRGRRTLVVEVELFGDRRQPAGLATLTFAVLPQPPGAPVLPAIDLGRRPAVEPSGVGGRPFHRALGLRSATPGVVEIDVVPAVQNSLGALNGGFLTSTIDAAVAGAATEIMGRPAETVDLQVAFLELGRVGPVRSVAELVGDRATAGHDRRAAFEITVLDGGADDEVLTRATAVAVAP
nr:hotdog domain-containing protein [Rhabdothermincola salaria]